ncbi:MAG: hypothetical protein DRH06_00075 [Deltaproteobacteria bacterium]|nr:MAG: hypothetical protein DRH06_00075 [Deltaproteobacteria bacterium]
MAGEALYRRAGIGVDNPGMGFAAMQKVQQNAFKDALGGVEDILATQKESYTAQNTANMQEYLQNKISAGGLGADPVDMASITQKFGDRINMDAIRATEKEQVGRLKDDALGKASTAALSEYDTNEDLAQSGKVFRQSLLDAGMNVADADTETASFRDVNKYRDIDKQNELNAQYDTMNANLGAEYSQGGNDTMIDKYVNDNFKESQRPEAKRKAKAYYNELSKFDPQDTSDIADLTARFASDNRISEAGYAQKINTARGALDAAAGGNNQAAQATADQAIAQFGGDAAFGANGEFKEGPLDWAWNSIFQGDSETGDNARKLFGDQVKDLVAEGYSHNEALGLSIQAYNLQKAGRADDWTAGNAIDPGEFSGALTLLKNQKTNRANLTSALNTAQTDQITGMAASAKSQQAEMRKFKNALRSENRGTGEFDRTPYFGGGGGGGAIIPDAVGGTGGTNTGAAATNTVVQTPKQKVETEYSNILTGKEQLSATGEMTVPGVGFNAEMEDVNPPAETIPAEDIDIFSYSPAAEDATKDQTTVFNKYMAEIEDPDTSEKRKDYLEEYLQGAIKKSRVKKAARDKRDETAREDYTNSPSFRRNTSGR